MSTLLATVLQQALHSARGRTDWGYLTFSFLLRWLLHSNAVSTTKHETMNRIPNFFGENDKRSEDAELRLLQGLILITACTSPFHIAFTPLLPPLLPQTLCRTPRLPGPAGEPASHKHTHTSPQAA